MRRITDTIFICFIFFPIVVIFSSCHSTEEKSDLSEKNSVAKDTLSANTLSEMCWTNRNSDPEKAIEYGEKCIRIAEQSGLTDLVVKTKNYLGVVFRNKGDLERAYKLFNESLELAFSINDSLQLAYSYNNIGSVNRLMHDHEKAVENIMKARNIFKDLGDKEGIAYCELNASIIFLKQDDYIRTLKHLNEVIKIRRELNDTGGLSLAKRHMLSLYFKIREDKRALKEYQKMLVEHFPDEEINSKHLMN